MLFNCHVIPWTSCGEPLTGNLLESTGVVKSRDDPHRQQTSVQGLDPFIPHLSLTLTQRALYPVPQSAEPF